VAVRSIDQVVFVKLYRLAPKVLDAPKNPQAGDGTLLASRWSSSLLAQEITAVWRPAKDTCGH
jgi:hypothetical protein